MSCIYKNIKKIVAIGDLHGDILQLITILIHSKLIKKKHTNKCVSNSDYDIKNWEWTGCSTYLVQLGDIFDGGGRSYKDTFDDNEVEIYKFLVNLKKMAKEKKGNVILIIGNHEIMNFNKNYNYVQDKTLNKCLIQNDNDYTYKLNTSKTCNTSHRDKLFAIPNGPLAKSMCHIMKGVVKINNNIFCHGGISEIISRKYNIKEINIVLQLYLSGKKKYDDKLFQSIYGNDGIIWHRAYSKDNSACTQLKNTLTNLDATRMIVGHTPQKEGITNRCKEYTKNLWAIDVGLSRAFNTKINCQYLVIENNKPEVKTCTLLSECNI